MSLTQGIDLLAFEVQSLSLIFWDVRNMLCIQMLLDDRTLGFSPLQASRGVILGNDTVEVELRFLR